MLTAASTGNIKVIDSTARVQGELCGFIATLKEDRENMEHLADEQGRKILIQNGTWTAKPAVDARQRHFVGATFIINQYTSGWRSWVNQLKMKPAAATCWRIACPDALKKLLTSLGNDANSGGPT